MHRVDAYDEAKIESLAELTKEQRERLHTLSRDPDLHIPSVLAGLRLAQSLVVGTDLRARSGDVSVACTKVVNAQMLLERNLHAVPAGPEPPGTRLALTAPEADLINTVARTLADVVEMAVAAESHSAYAQGLRKVLVASGLATAWARQMSSNGIPTRESKRHGHRRAKDTYDSLARVAFWVALDRLEPKAEE